MNSFEDYTHNIVIDNNGTFVAYIPSICGCQAWGKTQQEAVEELKIVFETMQEEECEEEDF